jgi:hypothetical protein
MVKRLPSSFTAFGLLAALHGTSFAANLPSKVWVANWGTDSSSCGHIASPCANLQRAHDNVAAGGEIRVLTPGEYGGARSPKLAITKAVTISYEGPGRLPLLVFAAIRQS